MGTGRIREKWWPDLITGLLVRSALRDKVSAMNVHGFANEEIKPKQSRCVNLPDHRISAEENIHTRFFVIIDPVTSKGTFSIPKDNDPRAQTAVNSVALLYKRQEYKM